MAQVMLSQLGRTGLRRLEARTSRKDIESYVPLGNRTASFSQDDKHASGVGQGVKVNIYCRPSRNSKLRLWIFKLLHSKIPGYSDWCLSAGSPLQQLSSSMRTSEAFAKCQVEPTKEERRDEAGMLVPCWSPTCVYQGQGQTQPTHRASYVRLRVMVPDFRPSTKHSLTFI